jgi:anti-anti-sigma factor
MTAEKRFEIGHEAMKDGTLVVTPVGKLDVFSFIDLKNFITGLSSSGSAVRMVVDLSGVDYIASSGWSVLMSRRQAIQRDGGNLAVFGMNENLRRVYDSMLIDDMLPLGSSREHAVELLASAK